MVIGNDLHNATQIEALETLDAVVVVDEMNCGIRYAWGQVDTKLPPMEVLAHYYILGRPVDMHTWNSDGRLEFIGEMAEQYKVDGVVSEIVRFCTYNTWDKWDLEKQMDAQRHPDPGHRPRIRPPGRSAGEDPRRGVHGDAGEPGELACAIPRSKTSPSPPVGDGQKHNDENITKRMTMATMTQRQEVRRCRWTGKRSGTRTVR